MTAIRQILRAGPRIGGQPIVANLYGASRGIIDLGSPEPNEIVVQLDPITNSAARVGLLVSQAGASEVGDAYPEATGSTMAGSDFDQTGVAGDTVEVLSDTAGDVRTVTIYGTYNGTNIVVTETLTLNGVTFVPGTQVWGTILGIEASAAHATAIITVREASGNNSIAQIAGAGVTNSGVFTLAAARGYGLPVRAYGDGASTKKVGVVGTNPAGTTIYDAFDLTGTTAVLGAVGMTALSKVLAGDLESIVNITFERGNLAYGAAAAVLTNLATKDDGANRAIMLGGRYLHWCLADSTGAAVTGGVADRLRIEPYG